MESIDSLVLWQAVKVFSYFIIVLIFLCFSMAMASSSRPMGEINALCANLTLEEEEAGGIEVEEDQAEQAQ